MLCLTTYTGVPLVTIVAVVTNIRCACHGLRPYFDFFTSSWGIFAEEAHIYLMSAVNWPHEQNTCDLHDCIFSAETVLLFTREATMHYFQCDWGSAALNRRLAELPGGKAWPNSLGAWMKPFRGRFRGRFRGMKWNHLGLWKASNVAYYVAVLRKH